MLQLLKVLIETKIYLLSVTRDPSGVPWNTGIDGGELHKSIALDVFRRNSNNNTIVVKRTTSVTQALIATASTRVTGAQHVVSNGAVSSRPVDSAGILVHGPDLDLAKLIRRLTVELKIINNSVITELTLVIIRVLC